MRHSVTKNNVLIYESTASTFAEMKKQVDKDILNLLSFTFTQTLRGQVEKVFLYVLPLIMAVLIGSLPYHFTYIDGY